MVKARWAVAALILASGGDLVGVVHQLTSSDRPPVPAIVVSAVLGVVGLACARGMRLGLRWSVGGGIASRLLDIVLLVGAMASGQVFGESASHVVPGIAQLGLSAVAAGLLLAVRPRLAVAADA